MYTESTYMHGLINVQTLHQPTVHLISHRWQWSEDVSHLRISLILHLCDWGCFPCGLQDPLGLQVLWAHQRQSQGVPPAWVLGGWLQRGIPHDILLVPHSGLGTCLIICSAVCTEASFQTCHTIETDRHVWSTRCLRWHTIPLRQKEQLIESRDFTYGGWLVPRPSLEIWDIEITFGWSVVEAISLFEWSTSISKCKCSHLDGQLLYPNGQCCLNGQLL